MYIVSLKSNLFFSSDAWRVPLKVSAELLMVCQVSHLTVLQRSRDMFVSVTNSFSNWPS